MEVGFNLPRPNCSHTEYGKRFTLAPRSSKALSILESPVIHEKMGLLASLYSCVVSNDWTYLFSKNAFLCMLSLRLAIHKYFKILAYEGICFMASKRGMFTLTYLSTSNILAF